MRLEVETSAGIWVAHDGELDDVCRLLDELGADWSERRGPVDLDDRPECLRAVIATPQRLLEARFDAESGPLRVAIAERATRTVASMLRRSGVERIVTRPVHPAALRALLLHTIYCGPEKRRRQRVSVGAPIRFRSGLIPHRAILAELSTRGCRLLTAHAARREAAVQLSIPGRVTSNGHLSLRGRVVRTGPASGEDAGTQSIVVIFSDVNRQRLNRLQQLVDTHARGPATLPASQMARRRRVDPAIPIPAAAPPASEPSRAALDPIESAESEPLAAQGSERRTGPRREYEHSVIALSTQAARVLIGRDISLGGMRVEPHDDLALGDALQLALHLGQRTEPLVLRANIVRDDGDRGLVLRFHDLSESDTEHLTKMVDDLTPLDDSVDPDDSPAEPAHSELHGQVVVSQILEHVQDSA